MRRVIVLLLLVVVLLLLPSGVRLLRYYQLAGRPAVAPPPAYDPSGVVALVPTPPANAFVDDPQTGLGLVLLDESHQNSFKVDEISYLDSRLAARGFDLAPFRGGDLRAALRPVNALIVIAPLSAFSRDEVVAVADFVARGGRLLLVGDPTRFNVIVEETAFSFTYSLENDRIPLNSLANEFDLVFNGDYLYNTVQNEGNFRNILLGDGAFAEDGLTDGLGRLAFYGAHSLLVGPTASALLTADDNTWSSATDRPGGLVLAARGGDDRVLALGDVDFLADPYFTVYDNTEFITRLADFLTDDGRREFALSDFPFFFGPAVDLVFTGQPDLGPDAFDEVIALQEAFRRAGRSLLLAAEPDEERDSLYLGLYNQAEEVAGLLADAGIVLTIDPPVEEEEEVVDEEDEGSAPAEDDAVRLLESPLGRAQMSGTALILLDESGGRRQVVVLAASHEGLEKAIERLLDLLPVQGDYALADCLTQGGLALCPTGLADEQVEFQMETGGAPDRPPGEEEEERPGGGEGPGGSNVQGEIGLGDSVDGALDADEAHGWTFGQGPAVVDIILETDDEMDGVLELYDPDGELMGTADSGFSGGAEQLAALELGEGDYTIVVRDFFDEGGEYTLRVREAEPADIDAVDQGEIGLADPQEATLAAEESHAWTLAATGSLTMDIILASGEEMDGVLELYDPENFLIARLDAGLTGEEEILLAVELEEGAYTIVVSDYFDDGGDYGLLVVESSGPDARSQRPERIAAATGLAVSSPPARPAA